MDLLSTLSTHQDLYHTHTTLDTQTCIQEAIMLHALDHVTKCVVPILLSVPTQPVCSENVVES